MSWLSRFSHFSPLFSLGASFRKVYGKLAGTGMFEMMTASQDEDEHSMEMHMPYIVQVMKANPNYTLVPILIGSSRSCFFCFFCLFFVCLFVCLFTLVPILSAPVGLVFLFVFD